MQVILHFRIQRYLVHMDDDIYIIPDDEMSGVTILRGCIV